MGAAPRLTRAGVGLATAGLSLLGLGMAFANVELLLLAAFPLLLVALPLARQAKGEPVGARRLSTRTPRRGDAVDMDVHVRVPPRADLVELHVPLPPGVALDEGTNLLLVTRPGANATRLRIRAHGRGRQELGAVEAWLCDASGVLGPRRAQVAPPEALEVTPRAYRAGRVRASRRLPARASADVERARQGVESTDFRELRDYARGDPPKAINWKATARRFSALAGRGPQASTPLVNEYEREGRRVVLVLLDGGAPLRVGTTVETGLDHGVEAALSVAVLFLQQGARVGAAVYGARANASAAPDAGEGQAHHLEKALSPGDPDPVATPQRVLQGLQRHLAGARPTFVVVTRLTPANAPDLADLAERVRVLLGERGEGVPLHVLDVKALGLVPRADPAWDAAALLVEREDEESARLVTAAGARVIPWRPGMEDLRQVLARRGFL